MPEHRFASQDDLTESVAQTLHLVWMQQRVETGRAVPTKTSVSKESRRRCDGFMRILDAHGVQVGADALPVARRVPLIAELANQSRLDQTRDLDLPCRHDWDRAFAIVRLLERTGLAEPTAHDRPDPS